MSDKAIPENGDGPSWPAAARELGPDLQSKSPVGVGPFGATLAPVLLAQCGERLRDVHWFRTDWQRGGALTGYATYIDDNDQPQDVVIKLPVPPRERRWLSRLQDADQVVPIIYAHGESLNGYDFAWVIMQRMKHGPLGVAWAGREFDLLADVAGRFYGAASEFKPEGEPPEKDWQAILASSRRCVHTHHLTHEQRWNTALKKAQKKIRTWLKVWDARPRDQWCHGDLHLGNALTNAPASASDSKAVLIDFAETHLGCWVEDAVYFEHLFWARRDRLEGRKLCAMIAKTRKAAGLQVNADWPRWASIKRALLALGTPAMLEHAGDPAHVDAALEVLEREVG